MKAPGEGPTDSADVERNEDLEELPDLRTAVCTVTPPRHCPRAPGLA